MSNKYLTQDEIYQIECAIYNNDNSYLREMLSEVTEEHSYTEMAENVSQGINYTILHDTSCMIREDGRIINLKSIRPLKPMYTPLDIIVVFRGEQYRLSDIFAENNWKYDREEILKRYKNNKWEVSVPTRYKNRYAEL